jgi:hypothetical protein
LAVLTVQHWRDIECDIEELLRVARWRVVLVTMDVDVLSQLWLVHDYLPEALAGWAGGYPSIAHLLDLLPEASAAPIPVPRDCIDGFTSASGHDPRRIWTPICALAARRGISYPLQWCIVHSIALSGISSAESGTRGMGLCARSLRSMSDSGSSALTSTEPAFRKPTVNRAIMR